MTESLHNVRKAASGYLEKTHRPLNCLMFLLPLLAAHEAGQFFYPANLLATSSLAELLERFGAPGRFGPPVLIVLVLLAWHIATKEAWHVDADAIGGMLVESILGMLPLFGLWVLTGKLLSELPAAPLEALWQLPAALGADGLGGSAMAARILSGIGAGIYEEFLFRLAAIGLILLLLVDLLKAPRRPMILIAVVVAAIAFSLSHFLDRSSQFDWHRFVFYGLAGAYLAVVYVARGFGIAVGTHACYNVILALWP